MEIAIGVDRAALNATSEKRDGRIAGLEIMNLKTVTSLKGNPLNIMLIGHRMLHLANGDTDDMTIALKLNGRNMLLDGSINGVLDKKLVALQSINIAIERSKKSAISRLKELSHDKLQSIVN